MRRGSFRSISIVSMSGLPVRPARLRAGGAMGQGRRRPDHYAHKPVNCSLAMPTVKSMLTSLAVGTEIEHATISRLVGAVAVLGRSGVSLRYRRRNASGA